VQFSGIRSIAKNAGYLIAAQLLTKLARAIYVVVLARFLGPDLYGLFAYGQSWYLAFLSLPLLGLGFILSREVGRDRSLGGRVAGRTLTLQFLATIVAAVLCGVAGWFADNEPAARPLLLVFSLALAGRSLSIWTRQAFNAFEVSKYTLRLERVFRPIEVVIGIAVLFAGGGAVGVAAVHAVTWWIQAFGGLVIVHRRLTPLRPVWDWPSLARLLVQGLPIGLHTIFVAWLTQGTLVLYRHLAEAADLGQLALAIQALAILSVVAGSVSMAALPVLSRTVARRDGKDRQFAEETLRAGFVVGAVAGLAGMTVGPWLVDLALGERYLLAGQLLGPALWLLAPLTWGNGLSAVLVARGAFRGLPLCGLAGAASLTLTLPALVPGLGALGALLATGIGTGAWALCSAVYLLLTGALDLRRSVLQPGVAVALAVGAYFALQPAGAWATLLGSWAVLLCALFALGVIASPARLLDAARAALPGRPR
jgi:O-antigen/teichoic acid export membrane protein